MNVYLRRKLMLMIFPVILGLGIFPCRVKAESLWKNLQGNVTIVGGAAKYPEPAGARSLEGIVSNIIRILLALVGVIFLVLIVWGGYLWSNAGGNEDAVTKAKGYIINGVIGAVIISIAYLFTALVTSVLIQAARL